MTGGDDAMLCLWRYSLTAKSEAKHKAKVIILNYTPLWETNENLKDEILLKGYNLKIKDA